MDLTDEVIKQVEANVVNISSFLQNIRDVKEIITHLEGEPDDDSLAERALERLELLRGNVQAMQALSKAAVEMRNVLLAAIVIARPAISMRAVATVAGIDDSLATRVARAHGAKPRTVRVPKKTA